MSSNNDAAGTGFGPEWDDVRSGRAHESGFAGPPGFGRSLTANNEREDRAAPSDEDVRSAERDGRYEDSLAWKFGQQRAARTAEQDADLASMGGADGDVLGALGTSDTTNEGENA